jgi:1,4-alpha-glucan branching enzyme
MQLKNVSLKGVVEFTDANPFDVLGMHQISASSSEITCYLPISTEAWVEGSPGEPLIRLSRGADAGIYSAVTESANFPLNYLVCYRDASGYVERRHDPYSFPPRLSDFDIYLFKKGELLESYNTFGAHPLCIEGTDGVRFIVWAPNARAVSVVGNFNHWTVGMHPMQNVSGSGIWELFIPDIGAGELYKFAIRSDTDGAVRIRTDPYAFRTEMRPRTAAIVADLSFGWSDGDWIAGRKSGSRREEAISIYEMHFGSWRKPAEGGFFSYREIGNEVIAYVKDLGFTHIELLPVMEHPLDASWGYQVINYYAPTSRYGAPADLMWFINECHLNGIGVILDWVPAHFPDDEYGLSMYDGTHLYDHMDPRKGKHPDWGTNIFNYGRNEVRNYLLSNALYWADKYHVDGLRIDAVSSMLFLDYSRKEGEWVPNKYGGRENIEAIDFLRLLNSSMHERFPGVMVIAEESTAWGGVTGNAAYGGLGFDFKWNMGWMHDTLEYFSKDSIHRKYHQRNLTFSVWYAFSESFILPISHDEVVHGKGSMIGKMPGDYWQKFANLRLCYAYMFGSPGKKLLFMGNEFGQWLEWNENVQLDWALLDFDMHRKLTVFVRDLNRLYRSSKQLFELDCSSSGFEWIDFSDSDNSVISFIRHSRERRRSLVFIYNMTPVPRYDYRIGVPWRGHYAELLNSDASEYGGSGMGNYGGTGSEDVPMHGRSQSLRIVLPPLSAEVFRYEGE